MRRVAVNSGRSAIIVLAALVAGAASANATHVAGHPPSAPQIYDRALAFVRAQRYPPYVSYVVTVRAKVKERWLVEQFSSLCRSSDDRVITDMKPIGSTNYAQNPYGFNLKVRGLQIREGSNIDEPFGVPQMSPEFSFGLATLPPSKAPEGAYDIALAGNEDVYDHKTYHLTLTPRRSPTINRLRDLWIDTTSGTVWRLTTFGVFAKGQATTVPWIVDFGMEGGHWFIASETTTTPLLLGGYAPALNEYMPVPFASRYTVISYAFSDFDYPKQVPDVTFFEHKHSEATQM